MVMSEGKHNCALSVWPIVGLIIILHVKPLHMFVFLHVVWTWLMHIEYKLNANWKLIDQFGLQTSSMKCRHSFSFNHLHISDVFVTNLHVLLAVPAVTVWYSYVISQSTCLQVYSNSLVWYTLSNVLGLFFCSDTWYPLITWTITFSDLLSVVNSLCSVNMLLKCESQTNSRGSHTSYPVVQ